MNFDLVIEDAYYKWFQSEDNHPDYTDDEVAGSTQEDDIDKFLEEAKEILMDRLGVFKHE